MKQLLLTYKNRMSRAVKFRLLTNTTLYEETDLLDHKSNPYLFDHFRFKHRHLYLHPWEFFISKPIGATPGLYDFNYTKMLFFSHDQEQTNAHQLFERMQMENSDYISNFYNSLTNLIENNQRISNLTRIPFN